MLEGGNTFRGITNEMVFPDRNICIIIVFTRVKSTRSTVKSLETIHGDGYGATSE